MFINNDVIALAKHGLCRSRHLLLILPMLTYDMASTIEKYCPSGLTVNIDWLI